MLQERLDEMFATSKPPINGIVGPGGQRYAITTHCYERWAERFGGSQPELREAVRTAVIFRFWTARNGSEVVQIIHEPSQAVFVGLLQGDLVILRTALPREFLVERRRRTRRNEFDICSVCNEDATTEYEGDPSCGSPRCELTIQAAKEYHEECGNR